MDFRSLLAVVAICRWQLRQRLRLRLGWLLGWTIAGFSCAALMLAPNLELGVLRGGLVAALWLVAGPAALVLADDPAERDRLNGIDALFRARGISLRRRLLGRIVAGALAIFVRMALPLATCGLLVAALQGGQLALAWLGLTFLYGSFAALLLACLALTCGYGAAERGQSLFLVCVLLPWFLADSYRLGQLWSLPGLLMLSLKALEKLVVFG